MWKVKKIFVFGAFHEKARDQAHGAGPLPWSPRARV